MQFVQNEPLPLLVCPACNGAGHRNVHVCTQCHGYAFGLVQGADFWYFDRPLTRYHLKARKAEDWLERLQIAIPIGLGLACWVGFVLLAEQHHWWSAVFSSDFWLNLHALGKSLVWLGVIFLCYAWYRALVLNHGPEQIELKQSKNTDALPVPMDWGQIQRLNKRHKINIAGTFTVAAQTALENAFKLADTQHAAMITPWHLLHALLGTPSIQGIAVRLNLPVRALQEHIATQRLAAGANTGEPLVSPELQQIIFHAYVDARTVRDTHVREIELLAATVGQAQDIQELLYDLKVDNDKLTNVIAWTRQREQLREHYREFRRAAAKRSKYGIDRAMTAVATPYLNSYSQDITLAAKFGYLAPCVARDKEIDDIFRIIEAGRQSVALVGERGVGKMSIIEGIAQRMVEERVPERLRDKRLVQVSTSALLAGTTVSGAQERLIRIMHEVARARNIILFINNIHDLMGGGQGSMDVSETLSEFLGPGQFLTLATTTPDNFNQRILSSDLGTTLARVDVKEMSENQAIQVLESKAGNLEYKHQVFFSYDSIAQSVRLAQRFLRDQVLPESALSIMAEVASSVRASKGENHLVNADDVAEIIHQKTGVPVTSVTEDESQKLLRLEEAMHQRVVGQSEAVSLVASALRRARAEIRSQGRPIANFLFLGPTGVGKTELAKTIAEVYFGGEQRMVRLDMSEYQDKSGIYRLIGQPNQPGTGQLTEAVRQNPFSLVLLDELEKADPDILNLFLQVFDDGRLTDSAGRTIDFKDTIIIATSNAGTSFVQEQIRAGKALNVVRDALIRTELKQYYRPEFLNRFDGIVLFKPLEKPEIREIARFMLKRVAKDLQARGVAFQVEEAALDALADIGFDPDFGARPMRRAIQEKVENQLADLVLQGKLGRRDTVILGENAVLRIEVAASRVSPV